MRCTPNGAGGASRNRETSLGVQGVCVLGKGRKGHDEGRFCRRKERVSIEI
jgi:hypothetical protein